MKKVILAALLTAAASTTSGTEGGLIEELCIDLGADAEEVYGRWSNGATREELDAWIDTTLEHPERRKVLVSVVETVAHLEPDSMGEQTHKVAGESLNSMLVAQCLDGAAEVLEEMRPKNG